MRSLVNLLRALYTRLLLELLRVVGSVALIGAALYALTSLLLRAAHVASYESFCFQLEQVSPAVALALRIGVALGVQLAVVQLCRRLIAKRLRAWLERARLHRTKQGSKRTRRRRRKAPGLGGALRAGLRGAGAVLATILVIPLIVQPTLVSLKSGPNGWIFRLANLLDGTASVQAVDSTVGLYRRLFGRPVLVRGVSDDEFNATFAPPSAAAGEQSPPERPMLDRWDSLLSQIAKSQPIAFAQLKALVWVESAGAQYAVSRTGCAGITQFSFRTARDAPFASIFGVGQIYPCACDGACRMPRSAQRDLESGEPLRIRRGRPYLPCELADARFDPEKSLRAGWTYLEQLLGGAQGNLLIAYVAYNSGPACAKRLVQALGLRAATAGVAELGPHLTAALAPLYGNAAVARARGLLETHLPKLAQAERIYALQAQRFAWARTTGVRVPDSGAASQIPH